MKTCFKCKEEKLKTEFHSDPQKSDGLRPSCRNCECEKRRTMNAERSKREIVKPESKTCSKCKQTKSSDSFFLQRLKLDFLDTQCKDCRLEVASKKNKNKKSLIAKIKEERGCSHCGMKDARCLDFHHLDPTKKDFTIGQSSVRNWEKILNEIDKCEVVCANCHRIIHFKLIGTDKCIYSHS